MIFIWSREKERKSQTPLPNQKRTSSFELPGRPLPCVTSLLSWKSTGFARQTEWNVRNIHTRVKKRRRGRERGEGVTFTWQQIYPRICRARTIPQNLGTPVAWQWHLLTCGDLAFCTMAKGWIGAVKETESVKGRFWLQKMKKNKYIIFFFNTAINIIHYITYIIL